MKFKIDENLPVEAAEAAVKEKRKKDKQALFGEE